MALKTKPQGSKKYSTIDSDGRICIIHFSSTVDEAVTPATKEAFNKVTKAAEKRLTFSEVKYKLPEISRNIPEFFLYEGTRVHVPQTVLPALFSSSNSNSQCAVSC